MILALGPDLLLARRVLNRWAVLGWLFSGLSWILLPWVVLGPLLPCRGAGRVLLGVWRVLLLDIGSESLVVPPLSLGVTSWRVSSFVISNLADSARDS